MAITINTKTYNADLASSPNSVPYIGPANTLSAKDRIDLYRTYPKATKEFSGVARSRMKFTKTVSLTNALTSTGDIIGDFSFSAPVGALPADVEAVLADVAAALAQTWAKELVKNLDLTA